MHLALLVQQVQDAHLGLYEVDAGLIVVEVNQSPGDLLLHVLLLLQLEHMLHKHTNTGMGNKLNTCIILHIFKYATHTVKRALPTMLNCCWSFSLA